MTWYKAFAIEENKLLYSCCKLFSLILSEENKGEIC